LPPKQVIFNDPKHTEYDYWDLRLLKAFHFAEDFIRDGVPLWWDESDSVFFEVERRISKSKAALQRAEEQENGKDKKSPPGRYYIPVPKTRDGSEMPSFQDWAEEQERKKGRK
jgi:hypothetical protein